VNNVVDKEESRVSNEKPLASQRSDPFSEEKGIFQALALTDKKRTPSNEGVQLAELKAENL